MSALCDANGNIVDMENTIWVLMWMDKLKNYCCHFAMRDNCWRQEFAVLELKTLTSSEFLFLCQLIHVSIVIVDVLYIRIKCFKTIHFKNKERMSSHVEHILSFKISPYHPRDSITKDLLIAKLRVFTKWQNLRCIHIKKTCYILLWPP